MREEGGKEGGKEGGGEDGDPALQRLLCPEVTKKGSFLVQFL